MSDERTAFKRELGNLLNSQYPNWAIGDQGASLFGSIGVFRIVTSYPLDEVAIEQIERIFKARVKYLTIQLNFFVAGHVAPYHKSFVVA